jgi:ABC-type branched-subunit amino acid transport system substrate-binding protein
VRRLAPLMIGVALAASACGGSGAGAPRTMTGTLVIANLNPFSGADADFGPEMYAGCYAAVQLINRAGGVLGHSLDCIKADTQSDAQAGALAARRMLASTPNLVAVLGPSTDEALLTVPLINGARVPMFPDAGQGAFDRSTYAYLWRMIPSDDATGYAMAIWAHKQGYRRGVALFGLDAQTNVPTLVKGFQQLGGSIVANRPLEEGKASYVAEVDAVLQTKPDVIFTEINATTGAAFLSELLKRHAVIPIVGTQVTLQPGWFVAVSQAIGAETLAKSFVAVQPYAAPQGRPWEIFNDALLASGSEVPNPEQWSTDPYTISDYDSVTIVALAMVAAGTTDPAFFNPYVRTVTTGGANTVQVHSFDEGLTALGTGHPIQYVGPSGPMAFDQWQNAPGGFSVAVYDPSGETKLIESISATAIGALSR